MAKPVDPNMIFCSAALVNCSLEKINNTAQCPNGINCGPNAYKIIKALLAP